MLLRRQGWKDSIFATMKRKFQCIHVKPRRRLTQSLEFDHQQNEGTGDIGPLTTCRNHHKLSWKKWL